MAEATTGEDPTSMAETLRKEVRDASAAYSMPPAGDAADPEAAVAMPAAAEAQEAEKEEEEEEEEVVVLTVVAPGVRVSKTGAVVPTAESKLGMLYVAVLKQLLESNNSSASRLKKGGKKVKVHWQHRRALPMGARSTWDLLLSEAQGQSIPWKKLGALLADREALAEANASAAASAVAAATAAAAAAAAADDDLSSPEAAAAVTVAAAAAVAAEEEAVYRPPLVNFSRGFQALCRKAMLVTTLRRHSVARPQAKVGDWFPKSFVFYPAKPERSEKKAFLEAFAEKQNQLDEAAAAAAAAGGEGQSQPPQRNVWILKPSDGAKGERIRVMDGASPSAQGVTLPAAATLVVAAADDDDDKEGQANEAPTADGNATADASSDDDKSSSPEAIVGFLEGQPAGSISWVVSEYLESPMLLQPGDRKFDWRLWVLLQPDYTIRLYREGVLRTCSVPYSLEDLSDDFAHLSNHCIQEKSQAFGQFGLPTNEMFYAEWEKLLEASHGGGGGGGGGSVLRDVLLPKARHVIVETLLAVRETLSCDQGGGSHVSAFNVFGFDLMVDDALGVKLIEVNSSPAVADALLDGLSRDLVDLQLMGGSDGAYFGTTTSTTTSSASGGSSGENGGANGWEVIFDPAVDQRDEAADLARLTASANEAASAATSAASHAAALTTAPAGQDDTAAAAALLLSGGSASSSAGGAAAMVPPVLTSSKAKAAKAMQAQQQMIAATSPVGNPRSTPDPASND